MPLFNAFSSVWAAAGRIVTGCIAFFRNVCRYSYVRRCNVAGYVAFKGKHTFRRKEIYKKFYRDMKKRTKVAALVFALALAAGGAVVSSCYRTQLINDGSVKDTEAGKIVRYEVAKNYFVRNDVTSYGAFVVEDKKKFEDTFGAAAVMGKDGLPTAIDFSRQCVLCVTCPPTNADVRIEPVSLRKSGGVLTLVYTKRTVGAPLSYSVTPCLLLVTRKQEGVRVEFEEK